MSALRISLVVLLLAGCSKNEAPTITFPLSSCKKALTGQTRHQHRAAYTTFISVQVPQSFPSFALAHPSAHPSFHPHPAYHPTPHEEVRPRRLVPVFHPARDWDEEEIATTCTNLEWQTKQQVEK